MKFKKILVTGFSRSSLGENIWARIGKTTQQIVFEPTSEGGGFDCLFSRFNKVDKGLIDSLPQLKYIGLLATGTGTVDIN
jgi:lactate dehydrogenase-like 2-hydroxyacid dehydrogenase